MKVTQKIITVMLIVLMFGVALFTVGAQDNAPQVHLNPDKTQVNTGDTVTVTVNVTGTVGVYGGGFKLGYDAQAFEVVQTDNKPVIPGTFFASEPGFALRNAVDPAAGTIEYAITLMQPAKPVNGDGILGTFTLRALKDAVVDITPISASFVAPEFKEVDGHLVAQKVNQVTAQIQSVSAVASAASVENVAVSQPVVSDSSAANMFSSPQLNVVPADNAANPGVIPVETVNSTDKVVSVAAVSFLVIGIVLLTLSVGMYSRMRVQYTSLAGNK